MISDEFKCVLSTRAVCLQNNKNQSFEFYRVGFKCSLNKNNKS